MMKKHSLETLEYYEQMDIVKMTNFTLLVKLKILRE